MKCTRCGCLLLEKPVYLCVVSVFRQLKITLESEQPMLKEKRILPSPWGGIKSFEHFQRGEYFSDCAFDLFVSWVRLLSPGWIKTRFYSVISKCSFTCPDLIIGRVFFIFNYIVLFSSALWNFLFFRRNDFLCATFPFHSLWSRERQLPETLYLRNLKRLSIFHSLLSNGPALERKKFEKCCFRGASSSSLFSLVTSYNWQK